VGSFFSAASATLLNTSRIPLAHLLSVIGLYHNNKQQQQKHHHEIAIKMSLLLPTNESLSVSLNDLFAPVSFVDLIVAYAFGGMYMH
jgi:hypothetical protein